MNLNLEKRMVTCVVFLFFVNAGFVCSTKRIWGMPTLTDYKPFNVMDDVFWIHESIHGTMKGDINSWCCYSRMRVIDVLAQRSLSQRLAIKSKYEDKFHHSIVEDFKKLDPFKPVDALMLYLIRTPEELFVNEIGTAIFGLGTDEDVLNEAVCCRRSVNFTRDQKLFFEYFGLDMLKEVMDDVSGLYGDLVKALLTVERAEEIDYSNVKTVARTLAFVSPNSTLEIDKSLLIKLFSERSFEEIQLVSVEYAELAEVQLMETLNWEVEGDFGTLIRQILLYAEDPIKYYATRIHDGLYTYSVFQHLYTVNRFFLKTADTSLDTIKYAFTKMYGQSLEQFVTDNTSGDYHYAILHLIKGTPRY